MTLLREVVTVTMLRGSGSASLGRSPCPPLSGHVNLSEPITSSVDGNRKSAHVTESVWKLGEPGHGNQRGPWHVGRPRWSWSRIMISTTAQCLSWPRGVFAALEDTDRGGCLSRFCAIMSDTQVLHLFFFSSKACILLSPRWTRQTFHFLTFPLSLFASWQQGLSFT